MTRIFLSTAAALAIGLAAANAQSDRQERGGASAQPRSEDSRPTMQPGDAQRRPQQAQSNDRSPAGARRPDGSGNAGRHTAQRPAEQSERAAGDARSNDGASERADRRRDRSQRNAAGADRDRSRETSRSRDGNRSAGDRRRDRDSDRAARRDRDSDEADGRRSSESGRAERVRSDRAARSGQNARSEVSLSGEQRERVSARFASRIDSMNVRPVSRSRLSVSVGATIPSSIRLYPVPSDVISIYPRFRGYHFVLVEDEIVIVEPHTRRIVTTIERSGGAVASRSSRSTSGAAGSAARIRLSPEERRMIHTTVVQEPVCRLEQRIDFFIGIPLPSTVEVCEFPERIMTEVPELRRYRYMVRDEEVVVIDPDERRVVEVIR